MLNYWNWGCRIITSADFLVFRMPCNGTENAHLLKLRMLIYCYWGCWFYTIEDVEFFLINSGWWFWYWGCWFNWTEDAELLELRMLINWYWRCWFIGTEDAGLIQLRMLNYWNWECWLISTEKGVFMVFRMLCNTIEDADLLELRMPI